MGYSVKSYIRKMIPVFILMTFSYFTATAEIECRIRKRNIGSDRLGNIHHKKLPIHNKKMTAKPSINPSPKPKTINVNPKPKIIPKDTPNENSFIETTAGAIAVGLNALLYPKQKLTESE